MVQVAKIFLEEPKILKDSILLNKSSEWLVKVGGNQSSHCLKGVYSCKVAPYNSHIFSV